LQHGPVLRAHFAEVLRRQHDHHTLVPGGLQEKRLIRKKVKPPNVLVSPATFALPAAVLAQRLPGPSKLIWVANFTARLTLDVSTALAAVFVLGFGADSIKKALTTAYYVAPQGSQNSDSKLYVE
jgi:hypothetical protein